MEDKSKIDKIVGLLQEMDSKSLSLIANGAQMLVAYQKMPDDNTNEQNKTALLQQNLS